MGPGADDFIVIRISADGPGGVGDGRELEHDLIGLGLGQRLLIGHVLLLLLEAVGLLDKAFNFGIGAAFELAFELADLVGDFFLLGAEGVGLELGEAALFVRFEPGIDKIGGGDALDAGGLADGFWILANEFRIEHRGGSIWRSTGGLNTKARRHEDQLGELSCVGGGTCWLFCFCLE